MKNRNFAISSIFLLALAQNAVSMEPAEKPAKLKELAAQKTLQNVLSVWDKAWQQHPTDYQAAKEAVDTYIGTAPIKNILAAKLYEAKKGPIINLLLQNTITSLGENVDQFCFDPQNDWLLSSSGNTLTFWNLETFAHDHTITEENQQNTVWNIDYNGKTIATWEDPEFPDEVEALPRYPSNFNLRFREDNFITAQQIHEPNSSLIEVKFDPQNHYLFTTHARNRIVIRNNQSKDKEILNELSIPANVNQRVDLREVGISDDGNHLIAYAIVYEENVEPKLIVAIWERSKWCNHHAQPRKPKFLNVNDFKQTIDSTGTWIAIATTHPTSTLSLLNIKKNVAVGLNVANTVRCFSFSTNGAYLAFAVEGEETVSVFDVNNNFLTLYDHEEPVKTVTISPDNQLLFSTGEDQNMLVWDIQHENPMPIASIAIDEPDDGIIFSPTIFLAKLDGKEKIKLWHIPQKGHLFSFDQTLYLLALSRAVNNPNKLSKQQLKALLENLKAPLEGLFDKPWIKNHIKTLIGILEFRARLIALKSGYAVEDLQEATQTLLAPPHGISEVEIDIYRGTLISFILIQRMRILIQRMRSQSENETRILQTLLDQIQLKNPQEEYETLELGSETD